MNRLASLIHFTLFLFIALTLPAQEGDLACVSQLQAQSMGGKIVLTWKDNPVLSDATNEVYRYSKEITKNNIDQAQRVGTVASKVEHFEDTGITGSVFYIILVKDKSGHRQDYFINYRNKTMIAISLGDENLSDTARIAALKAIPYGKQILVSFNADPGDRKMMIFRSTVKISSILDLKDATFLGQITGIQAPFKDTPQPGIDYYYTVLDARAYAEGNTDVFSTQNTLDVPVSLPLISLPQETQKDQIDPTLRPAIDQTIRPLPLPTLIIEKDAVTGSDLPKAALAPQTPQKLGTLTQKILTQISKGSEYGAKSLPPLVILNEEQGGGAQGSQKVLNEIVHTYMEGGEWPLAQQQLELLLKLTLEEKLTARVHFYLGECLAYTKEYQRSVLEFLLAQSFYHQQSEAFMDSLLSQLHYSGDANRTPHPGS